MGCYPYYKHIGPSFQGNLHIKFQLNRFNGSGAESFMALTQLNRFSGSSAESFMVLTNTGRQRLARLRKDWYFLIQTTTLWSVLAKLHKGAHESLLLLVLGYCK